MKIAICDDREDDRGALKALLEAYRQDFEIREYGSGKSLCGDMIIYGNAASFSSTSTWMAWTVWMHVFYTKEQTFSIYKKMDELEEDLKGMVFVRIHQSFLINMKYIFFPVLNYSLLFLTDLFSLQVENILMTKNEAYASKLAFLSLPAKLVWFSCFLYCAVYGRRRAVTANFPIRSGGSSAWCLCSP